LFTDINCVPNIKVGIGLTNPTAKFHIKMATEPNDITPTHAMVIEKHGNNAQKIFQITKDGLVLAREFKVDMVACPDYVFDKNYDLMPLSEVDNFIQQNGHLPNVPKAETIENEGLALGEMNKILMEKVEELTLYLLQQQKQLDQQMKLLEEQAKKIGELSNVK
jgi:hypothetical protein